LSSLGLFPSYINTPLRGWPAIYCFCVRNKKKNHILSTPTCKEKKKEESPLSLVAVYHIENREEDQNVFETFFTKVLIFALFFTSEKVGFRCLPICALILGE
jgi:hypothetical protein